MTETTDRTADRPAALLGFELTNDDRPPAIVCFRCFAWTHTARIVEGRPDATLWAVRREHVAPEPARTFVCVICGRDLGEPTGAVPS